jgi:hypothetical protein
VEKDTKLLIDIILPNNTKIHNYCHFSVNHLEDFGNPQQFGEPQIGEFLPHIKGNTITKINW